MGKKKYTTGEGLSLTDPYVQSLAGQWSTKKGRKSGNSLSNKDLIEMDFSQKQLQQKNDFTEYMYNQYQSPAAMMRQYQEAGLNPALMYEGAGSGSPTSSNSEGSMSLGSTAEESTSGIMSSISSIFTPLLNAVGLKSEIDERNSNIMANTARAEKDSADAAGVKIDNSYKDMHNILDLAYKAGEITEKQLNVSLLQLSLTRESDPEVFEARKQQILEELNLTKKTGEKVEAEKGVAEAEKGLIEAQTTSTTNEESRNSQRFETEMKYLDKYLSDRNANLEKSTELIGKQITSAEKTEERASALFEIQKELNNVLKDNAKLRQEFDQYAKDNHLPLGDYTLIALYRYYGSLDSYFGRDNQRALRNVMEDKYRKGVSYNALDPEFWNKIVNLLK